LTAVQTPNTWRVTAASVRGASHIKADLPCQDAHEWSILPSGCLLAAVADGAGSAKESQAGARTACRTALEFLQREFPKNETPAVNYDALLRSAVSAARDAVLREAAEMKLPPRELASTLMLAIAEPGRVAAAQVGDGAALVLAESGELLPLTQPVESEYLNETLFLTGDTALEQLQTRDWPGRARGLALFSDGLQMLALKWPGRTPHKPFFDPLFRFVESENDAHVRLDQLQKFLQSPRIVQRADDDLTLLLAVRAQQG
jgi:hypothetical protein